MQNVFIKFIKYFFLSFLVITKAHAIDFETALKTALTNANEIKQLALQYEITKLEEQKAFAGYLPKVDLTARHIFAEHFEEIETEVAGATFVMPAVQPYTLFGVKASVNVFNGFQTQSQLEAWRFAQNTLHYRIDRATEVKRTQVRSLFYKALGSKVLVDVADQNIRTLQSHLDDIKARARHGVSTRYDILRIEVQLEDARTEKVAAESGLAVARARLFNAISLIDKGEELEGTLPSSLVQIDISKIQTQNINRSDRQALESEYAETKIDIKTARSHWLPKVSVFGNYDWYNNIDHATFEDSENFKSSYILGLQITWNIYEGTAGIAEQQKSILASQMVANKLVEFDQNRINVLEDAKSRFSYNMTNYKAKLVSIRKAEEALRLARGELKAGTRTNVDVLDAVVDLNRTKASEVKSLIDAIEALGDLELSLGQTLLPSQT